MLIPRTNLLTCWTKGNFTPDEWNHLLRSAAIFFQLNSRTPCRRELRKEAQKKSLWWRNQSQQAWYQETWAQNNPPSLDSGASCSPGLDRNSVFMRTERSVRDSVQHPTASSQECTEMIIRFQALGDWCVESRTNLQGRSWTTTIFKSLTIYTLRTSSRMFDKSCIALRTTRFFLISKKQCFVWRLFMSTTMKAAVHYGQNYNENLVSYKNTTF